MTLFPKLKLTERRAHLSTIGPHKAATLSRRSNAALPSWTPVGHAHPQHARPRKKTPCPQGRSQKLGRC